MEVHLGELPLRMVVGLATPLFSEGPWMNNLFGNHN